MHLLAESISCAYCAGGKFIVLALVGWMKVVRDYCDMHVFLPPPPPVTSYAGNYLERLVSSLTGSRVKSQVSGKNERRETFGASILSFGAPAASAEA